ncbi:hypothetical protein EUTSA_v10019721mg [Eutrema salsugineum]|uniref:RNase H type-1 domain-containing protein n=1 Tax=Eutrema salsugineum TaxID=72664 RepID=V4JTG1_EUTSA|nr:uncharacterized protein LOC18008438 [Eutrema salsugineum]ESQ28600.1 hypothetical protein EUTSA_v10019721mg [Eutrema salsugineum]
MENTLGGGIGWLIKDTKGITILQGTDNRMFVPLALAAEAFAVKAALHHALDSDFTSLSIQSDSDVLVKALRSGLVMNEIAGILHDIRYLASRFHHISFYVVPRSANCLADALSTFALSEAFWLAKPK